MLGMRRISRRPAAPHGRGCTPWLRARPGRRSCPPTGPGGRAPEGPRPAAAVARVRRECSPPRRRTWRGTARRTAVPPPPPPRGWQRRPGRPPGGRGAGNDTSSTATSRQWHGVGQDDPPYARGRAAREPLARERALREGQDVVGDVDDGLPRTDEVPERARADVGSDHETILAPDHTHGGEVHLSVLVQRRHDRLDDHAPDPRIWWRCNGYWPSLPP